MTFKGASVAEAVSGVRPKGADLVILHFANGMLIPIPVAKLSEVDPFVAVGWRKGKSWVTKFPSVSKKSEKYNDPRPITFGKNKVVPKTVAAKEKDFSPWAHADTLVGIEFAREDAYYEQFRVSKGTKPDPGRDVFVSRCQFCHGITQVGASFGWDFLHPIPIYKLKQPRHLYNKVKYPYHDALERGLLMPQQPDVESGEMYALWGWLKQLHRQGVRSYK